MRHWIRAYYLLLCWNLLRRRSDIGVFLFVQALVTVGVVVGLSFLIPDLDQTAALYLTSGAMTIALITVGMTFVPQMLAQQKAIGTFEYQRSIPVPRLAMLSAEGTVWVAVTLPGIALAFVVAVLRFDLNIHLSPMIVPAALLVAAVSVAIGYGIVFAMPPALASLVANAILVLSLMFAPINYPPERLPAWLAEAHNLLPFVHMARAVRESITPPPGGPSLTPWLVLTAWAVISFAVTARVMTRRD